MSRWISDFAPTSMPCVGSSRIITCGSVASQRDSATFCRQGFGALIAKLAERLPVELSAAATRIGLGSRGGVDIETPRGRISARAAIVTVSTGVLAANKIRFTPDLPKRQLDAANALRLGSYDHIALELPGNPLGLQRDDLVFEKSESARTGALLANVGGSTLCVVTVGGKFGRDLAAQGEAAMTNFALDWLAGLYGPDVKKAVRRMSERADIVLVDSPPFLSLSDGFTLSEKVDAVIVVCRLNTIRRPMLTELKRLLEASPAEKLGFIVEPRPEPKRSAPSRRR